MPKLLNNTNQTFRALKYIGTPEKPEIKAVAVPPGFTTLSDADFKFFASVNQEVLDCGWVVDNNKVDESKKDVQPLDKPKKKKAGKKKNDAFKDFD